MSSETVKHTASNWSVGSSPPSSPITSRLTFLYTLSVLGRLALSTVFLHWVLIRNLEGKGNQFLADKIHVLRVILRERSKLSSMESRAVLYSVMDGGHLVQRDGACFKQ
jgi:hypothetical protein